MLLDAAGQGWLLPPDGSAGISVPYRPGRMYLFFAPAGASGRYEVPAGTRFRGIDIRVGLQFLERLAARELFEGLGDGHPLHAASCTGCWIGALPLLPELAAMAKTLVDFGLGEGGDLTMEARCLDMVDAAISLVREPPVRSLAAGRDRRRLEKARDLLRTDLARPWTIAELARGVGLSEKRLKSGFRREYGNPVYRFLQEARLREARRLLEQPDASVTSVAQAVGYGSASHFAKLFARAFGVQPSAFRAACEVRERAGRAPVGGSAPAASR